MLFPGRCDTSVWLLPARAADRVTNWFCCSNDELLLSTMIKWRKLDSVNVIESEGWKSDQKIIAVAILKLLFRCKIAIMEYLNNNSAKYYLMNEWIFYLRTWSRILVSLCRLFSSKTKKHNAIGFEKSRHYLAKVCMPLERFCQHCDFIRKYNTD